MLLIHDVEDKLDSYLGSTDPHTFFQSWKEKALPSVFVSCLFHAWEDKWPDFLRGLVLTFLQEADSLLFLLQFL